VILRLHNPLRRSGDGPDRASSADRIAAAEQVIESQLHALTDRRPDPAESA
jgi:hypothetical protein